MTAHEISIDVGNGVSIAGTWGIPTGAAGIVVFAHGSGSSRFSKRNGYVAMELQRAGFATLLLDLLTKDEEHLDNVTGELRFDIPFLAARVVSAADWVGAQRDLQGIPVGLFGASTGAAAALSAAAARAERIAAVVSRGGRPDLALEDLAHVRAPTLLIVGANDPEVLRLNERAYARLTCKKQLSIVPRATHLFEEEGTLEQVSALARDWFRLFLTAEAERTAAETR